MGVAIIPGLFVPDESHISKIKIEDAPKLSFGIFYHSYSGNEVLKRFIQITNSHFIDNIPLSTEFASNASTDQQTANVITDINTETNRNINNGGNFLPPLFIFDYFFIKL